jgi:hypothetical protein
MIVRIFEGVVERNGREMGDKWEINSREMEDQ